MAFAKTTPRKGETTSVRLTGFFRTKRPNLMVGSIKHADLGGLVAKLKEAMQGKKDIAFFLWKNDEGKGPRYSLSADVSDPYVPKAKTSAKAIEDDPFGDDPDGPANIFGDD